MMVALAGQTISRAVSRLKTGILVRSFTNSSEYNIGQFVHTGCRPSWHLNSLRGPQKCLLWDCRHKGSAGTLQTCRAFSTSARRRDQQSGDRNMRLMDFPLRTLPSPVTWLRNQFMSFLLRSYYIEDFTQQSFLKGAETAMVVVSNHLSEGNFSALEGLVTDGALNDLKHRFRDLNEKQKSYIALNPRDIMGIKINEIGMIFNDHSKDMFVEITVVLSGVHGIQKVKEKLARGKEEVSSLPNEIMQMYAKYSYLANYRFRREITKGVEDDWTVTMLNMSTSSSLTSDY